MSGLYDFGREGFLGADIDWNADDLRCALIDDSDDPPNLAADQFWSDRLAAARVAVMAAGMTSPTITAGVADAADVTLPSVTGDPADSIDIFSNTGVESTSRMICNINSGTGLPVTPNGGDITITWDSGADRIFKL